MTKMAEISLNWYPIYEQNSRKTIPFGAAHTYIHEAQIREHRGGGGGGGGADTAIDASPNQIAVFSLH